MLDGEQDAEEFMKKRMSKSSRRYVEHAVDQRANGKGKISTEVKSGLSTEEVEYARKIFLEKHKDFVVVFMVWRFFVNFIAGDDRTRITVCRKADGSNKIIALFVEFLGQDMHYFITALVDHDEAKESGVYLAKYKDMIGECLANKTPVLRLGPKADSLKKGLGAISLPLLVVSDPVWARVWDNKLSVISFGIFASTAIGLFILLSQVNLDVKGVGSLSFAGAVIVDETLYAISVK